MRVAYLVNVYPTTSHSFIRREIQALEGLGTEVCRYSIREVREPLVSREDREEQAKTAVILGAGVGGLLGALLRALLGRPVHLLQALDAAFRLGWRSDRGLLRHLVYLAEACVLADWARRDRIEHIHAHFGTNPAAVARLCLELGGPTYSFTVHGPEEFDKPEFIGLREKVARATFVAVVSNFGRSQVCRWVPYQEWGRVHVVRCGIGDDILRLETTPVPESTRFLCVARLSEQKGHFLLLEAVARLAEEGRSFEVVLAGDGPLRGALEELIRTRRLERHVRVAGWLSSDQVRQQILESRALIQPSFAEGLPVVLMEAMALGRPVVTTFIAGIPELVEPGVSGWLVPAGSVDDLVDAMKAVLDTSPGRLTDMGRSGRGRVLANHDASREARKLLDHFEAFR